MPLNMKGLTRDQNFWFKSTIRPSQGIVPVPLFPWNKWPFSPCSPKTKSWFSMFPVPQNCLCSPVSLIYGPLFPCSLEKYALVPQNPWEGLNNVARIETSWSWIIFLANAISIFKINFGHKFFFFFFFFFFVNRFSKFLLHIYIMCQILLRIYFASL